ncbi:MAG: hypothetical protein WC788_08205 [Candidatus Paceibacterota bacterium]|jgi:hypothetical protein
MTEKKYKIYNKDEEIGEVDEVTGQKIAQALLDKNSGMHIKINGEVFKRSAITVRSGNRKVESTDRKVLHNGELMPYGDYMNLWNAEQKEIRKSTPEEKAFKNYKCKFAWYYLLQVGYSNFFGLDDWKRMSAYDTFRWFDKLIWEKKPEMMSKFTKTMESFFTENPNEIWIDRKMFLKFLPRSAFKPIVQSMSRPANWDIPHTPVKSLA